MAVNVQFNVYQINQKPFNVNGLFSQRIGFPTAAVQIRDCSAVGPTRSLSTGFNVYSLLIDGLGNQYYVGETLAVVAALIG